jgi:glycosyltransferase involved in cell wall biosynthesis
MKLSIILPTYNNDQTIKECLTSIFNQDFPTEDFEVLFLDGGSSDNTLRIADKFPVKILENKKRNEEAARILGISKAKGEILCFIDADNILLDKNWFTKMLQPFEEKEIAFADTLYYSYRKKDKWGVKYQALIGGDDPFVMYMGYYSRWSHIPNNWTDYPYELLEEDKIYMKVKLRNKNLVPAIGSNGFLVRKKIAKEFIKESFIHSDFIYELINSGHNCFAKVKTGIVHNQPKFFPNKIRRVQRRNSGEVDIKYQYGTTKKDILKSALYVSLVLPVLFDTIKGFLRKPEAAWLFHPIACFGELGIYVFYTIKGLIFKEVLSR